MTDTDQQPRRRLDYLPLADLQARMDPRNPKDHAEEDIDGSLGRFGYTEPILLDERTGMLVAGHGRVEALLRLRETSQRPPDGVVLEGDEWLMPVVRGWASSDDAEAAAYLIASNRLTEKGGWRGDALADLAELVRETDSAFYGTGVDMDWLDDMLAGIELPPAPTDADYAEHTNRGEPQPTRQAQGIHEVVLAFQDATFPEYSALLAELRQVWGAQLPAPMVVLRALRTAAGKPADG